MHRKLRREPRLSTVHRIALATVSSLAAGSIVLSLGPSALAQPTPSPTHATPTPTHVTPTPSPTHATTTPIPEPVSTPAPRIVPLTDVPSVLGEATGPGTCTATHVVVPGDTLSDIAAALLGDAGKWTSIYDANQSLIESVARQHPRPPVFGVSDHGWWIFPGTTLAIPGVACPSGSAGTGDHPQLDQTSLAVKLLMATGMSQTDAELTLQQLGGCLTGIAFGKILSASNLDTGTKATIRSGKFGLEVVTGQKAGTGAEFLTSIVLPTVGGLVSSKVANWLSFKDCIIFEPTPAG
ncbi:LysM domain-containing protein [Streptomyces sp. TLI_235]|nr:LysM domain-containing protein [Streptomyces sp. TLI_235]